jgi:hypothetical protein
MRLILLSHVACLVLSHFFTLSHVRDDLGGKKKLLNIKCVFCLSLQILSEKFLILVIIQRVIIINVKLF